LKKKEDRESHKSTKVEEIEIKTSKKVKKDEDQSKLGKRKRKTANVKKFIDMEASESDSDYDCKNDPDKFK